MRLFRKNAIESIMNNIKIILKKQGRSQAWLAEHIDKSYVITTNYCNNKTQPSIPTLYKIAEMLEVDVKELIGGIDSKLSNP
jgi:putative transcriptional regulator